MAHTRLMFRSEAREKILGGAAALADAVRITLGPKARCVLLENAVSIAGILLLAEATLTTVPEDEHEPAHADAA